MIKSRDRDRVLFELEFIYDKITDDDRLYCADNLHYCPEWDYMPIDQDSPEIGGCTCVFEDRGDPI